MKILSDTLSALQHFIWPSRCVSCDVLLADPESKLCEPCLDSIQAVESIDKTEYFDSVFSFFHYEGAAQTTIARWKYHADMAAKQAILDCVKLRLPLLPREAIRGALCLPVPPHPRRLIERGYDPVWSFAETLIQGLNGLGLDLTFSDELLKRARHTQAQASMGREARQHNLDDAFSLSCQDLPKSKIVLIDDMLTTGATAKSCAKCLKSAGAQELHLITLAVQGHQPATGDAGEKELPVPSPIKENGV